MLRKLRIKFVCIVMVIVTIMLSMVFGMVIHYMSKSLEEQSIRTLRSISANPTQQRNLGDISQEVRLPYFTVLIGFRGQLIATSGGYYDLSDEETILRITRAALEQDEQMGILKEYNLRFSKSMGVSGQWLVFADMSSERSAIRHLTQVCVLIGLASMGIFLCISIMLARWAVKPVEKAWKQQQQFVADASHELKTPLAVILTNAELLQDPAQDDSAKQQFSSSILTMSHQMRGLVEGLLELTRVDNGSVSTNFAPVDLSQLVEDAVLPFEPMYFEKGLTLSTTIEKGITLKASASHLRQVLGILLDNAMKYSAPEGRIWVKLIRHGSHCLLSVASPGQEISPEDLQNIFKRFYRVDKARSRDGSYGLGLSIAQSIVLSHKGKIWAESEDGINTFFIQLPVSGS